MALTKQDKKDIKEIVVEAIGPLATKEFVTGTIEPLATAIQADFGRMDERFDKIETRLRNINNRLDALELEILDIKKTLNNIVYRHEFELLKDRLTEVEKKLAKVRTK